MEETRHRLILGTLALLAGMSSHAASAATAFTYNGRLTEADGYPVSGPVELEIRFYAVAKDGSPLVPVQDFEDVKLDEGIFEVSLEFTDAQLHTIFPNVSTATYVEVKDVTHKKTYSRQLFSAVPYALK